MQLSEKSKFLIRIASLIFLLHSVSSFYLEESGAIGRISAKVFQDIFGDLRILYAAIFIVSLVFSLVGQYYIRGLAIIMCIEMALSNALFSYLGQDGGLIGMFLSRIFVAALGKYATPIIIILAIILFLLSIFEIDFSNLTYSLKSIFLGRKVLRVDSKLASSKDIIDASFEEKKGFGTKAARTTYNTHKISKTHLSGLKPEYKFSDLVKIKPKAHLVINPEAKAIDDTLIAHGVDAYVHAMKSSATVTSFEIKLIEGESLKKLGKVLDELNLKLKRDTGSIRLRDKDGKIYLEVPNKNKSIVRFKDLKLCTTNTKNTSVPIGCDMAGSTQYLDISKMPHALVAGESGGGKSSFLHTLINGLMLKNSPDELKFMMADLKMLDLSYYEGLPHLNYPVVYTPDNVLKMLNEVESIVINRMVLMQKAGYKDISYYNMHCDESEKLFYLVVIIDEVGVLMMNNNTKKNIEKFLSTLSMISRAAGVHMILTTQNPISKVITGELKANLGTQIALKVVDHHKSITILDETGAEELSGKGDMLIKGCGFDRAFRVQGAYIEPEEIKINIDTVIGTYGHRTETTEASESISDKKINLVKLPAEESMQDKDSELIDRIITDAIQNKSIISYGTLMSDYGIGMTKTKRIYGKIRDLHIWEQDTVTKGQRITITLEEWEERKKRI